MIFIAFQKSHFLFSLCLFSLTSINVGNFCDQSLKIAQVSSLFMLLSLFKNETKLCTRMNQLLFLFFDITFIGEVMKSPKFPFLDNFHCMLPFTFLVFTVSLFSLTTINVANFLTHFKNSKCL